MKKQILLIDDEPDLTLSFKEGMEDAGFNVDTFNDSIHDLENFKPGFYDLVILDIVMPNMDGFELYEWLKKIDPDMKACFLTASERYNEEFRKVEHCTLNEDLFLQKPISPDDLIKEINKRIDSSNNG